MVQLTFPYQFPAANNWWVNDGERSFEHTQRMNAQRQFKTLDMRCDAQLYSLGVSANEL
jgi:hypothetical protein